MNTEIQQDLSIIIPAAGEGTRLGLGPKALLTLGDHSLLYWVSQKARQIAAEVIVAVPENSLRDWGVHCPGCQLIAGGNSHLESMANLARQTSKAIVMNLNVVMPFTSLSLIRKVADTAKESGIAGAFIDIDLPIANVPTNKVAQLLPRQGLAIASGPNAYQREILLGLIDNANAEDWRRQSFLEIALQHGIPIQTVPGERSNIKITHEEDWKLAQLLVSLLTASSARSA